MRNHHTLNPKALTIAGWMSRIASRRASRGRRHRLYCTVWAAAGTLACCSSLAASELPPEWRVRAPSAAAGAAHATISEYLGPGTCIVCHQNEAEDVFHSVHYQQSGPTPNVPNIPGNAGKTDAGFNTYCGTPATSSRATCASCHVSYGRYTSPTLTTEQLHNIDCLMCHQDQYKRTPAGPFETVDVVGSDGLPATIQVPVEDETGFQYMPDEGGMSISVLEAARTVHPTTRASCLRCHAGASGSDGGKRGDMSSVTAAPPRSSDIHLSPQGVDLTCQACHQFQDHRTRGRGLDLRPNDRPERFTCESCHGDRPHGDYDPHSGEKRDTHALRVACQSCHIPTFAKDVSTEMAREWTNPVFSPAACSGQGGWKPEEIRESDVVPSYQWFDGTSEVYVLGQVPTQNQDGEYALGVPLGWVDTAEAKLYPMKEHRSVSGRLVSLAADFDGNGSVDLDDYSSFAACLTGPEQAVAGGCEPADTDSSGHVDLLDLAAFQECFANGCGTVGELIPHSTFAYFTTGDFDHAVEIGMQRTGLRGGWELVDVHTYQTINHGVEDEDNALNCGACHASLSGGPVRMNLQADLGYELKGATSQVCFQCHGAEEPTPFRTVHDIHVKDERFDCSWCHDFSRPERGLTLP